MTSTLLFRTQGGPGIGAGHVMRCLALAQRAVARGFHATFLVDAPSAPLWPRLREAGCAVKEVDVPAGTPADADAVAGVARDTRAEWVVCDGYVFGAAFHARLRSQGMRVLALDDNGTCGSWDCDVLLDQNLDAAPTTYAEAAPGTRILLGPRYALLRKEFLDARPARTDEAPRVLLTFGGSDPQGDAAAVLDALRLCRREFSVDAVVGALSPHRHAIEQALARLDAPARIHVDLPDLAGLMARAHLAVCSAGSTCWELARLGVPMLLCPIADNQTSGARALHRAGAAVDLGPRFRDDPVRLGKAVDDLLGDPNRLAAMGTAGLSLVDGRGAARVLAVLLGSRLTLRRAKADDARRLWEWANDPETRAWSFDPRPIPWEAHVDWLGRRLQDPGCLLLFAEQGSDPVGQVRFDLKDGVATISVSVAPAKRGGGLGAALLDAAVRQAFQETTAQRIRAVVKTENAASREAFLTAGFEVAQAEGIYAGCRVVVLERVRDRDLGRT